jgi:hypothetical protein
MLTSWVVLWADAGEQGALRRSRPAGSANGPDSLRLSSDGTVSDRQLPIADFSSGTWNVLKGN